MEEISARWRPDVLGAGFECADIDLGSDEEGPLVATLVRALPEPRTLFDRLLRREPLLAGVDVLYVHGWSDYFFQRDLARFWTERGARFFALDLRKYGRSLREGQTPGYVEDLGVYHEEIERALAMMGEQAGPDPRSLVLFGHSTGGLILSLWAAEHPDRADALILNSPWLEFQLSSTARQLIMPLLNVQARLNPREVGPRVDQGFYARAQREVGPPELIELINPAWRPEHSHAVPVGWLRAVLSGHARVKRGLNIEAPIQVLLSARNALPVRWSDELTRADTVLEVDEIAKAALRLGASVTVDRIEGALHDVFLSAEDARAAAYSRLERWVLGWRAARGTERSPLSERPEYS